MMLLMGIGAGKFKPKPPVDFGRRSPVLLYGFFDDAGGRTHTTASIGQVSSRGFEVVKTFRPDELPWYLDVSSAARGGKRWLLFHDHRDGRVMTGVVDGDLRFVQAYNHPAGFLPGWRLSAADGEGYLLATKPAGAQKTEVALASVEPDGSVTVWWRSEVGLPAPHYLLGTADAHVWVVVDEKADRTTAHVLHRGQPASQRTWNETWKGVATNGNLVSLYRSSRLQPGPATPPPTVPPRTFVGSVGADYRITDLADIHTLDAGLWPDVGTDVSTATGMFFLQRVGGADPVVQVRSLTAAGYTITHQAGTLPSPAPGARGTVWKVAAC